MAKATAFSCVSQIEATRRSIEAGFTFGPNRICACCATKIADADSISRGICTECWSEIETCSAETVA